jgi:hypothetical protein
VRVNNLWLRSLLSVVVPPMVIPSMIVPAMIVPPMVISSVVIPSMIILSVVVPSMIILSVVVPARDITMGSTVLPIPLDRVYSHSMGRALRGILAHTLRERTRCKYGEAHCQTQSRCRKNPGKL